MEIESWMLQLCQFFHTAPIGVIKKGDLSDVRVHKFKILGQEYLLAYSVDKQKQKIILLALGTHENFYRDLKR